MLRLAAKYLHYFFTSRGPHGIHSPFVYQLAKEILADGEKYPAYKQVEKLRGSLFTSDEELEIVDFGAGGEKGSTYKRKVSQISLRSAKPARLAQLLYRLCAYYQPTYMLELGTSLGISTAYQTFGALANQKEIHFTTLEGSPAIAQKAQENLNSLGIGDKVTIGVGSFDETLADTLKQFPRLDYVFFDGNHRYQPTIDYFNACLPLAHENTLFVFDDIRWSKEMEQAWEEIKSHPQVTITVDLFFMGLVFFRQGQAKQDFVVRF